MYGKLIIKCKLQVLTGMHIGGSSAFSAIGAVDSPVIRDSITGEPMLPGSSLKGKMRTLLAKALKNHYITQSWGDDPQELKRLFGTGGDKRENAKSARLQFADAFLINSESLKNRSGLTEVKFENSINRLTAIANPRQIERVVRGAEFALTMVYDMEEEAEIEEDFANIAKGLKLISMDYLGGHGTRGYGKVAFKEFQMECRAGQGTYDYAPLLNLLKEVEDYGIFSIQA
jgi:CRISPR-associated protein Csm3